MKSILSMRHSAKDQEDGVSHPFFWQFARKDQKNTIHPLPVHHKHKEKRISQCEITHYLRRWIPLLSWSSYFSLSTTSTVENKKDTGKIASGSLAPENLVPSDAPMLFYSLALFIMFWSSETQPRHVATIWNMAKKKDNLEAFQLCRWKQKNRPTANFILSWSLSSTQYIYHKFLNSMISTEKNRQQYYIYVY
jgi:hypothetical protein